MRCSSGHLDTWLSLHILLSLLLATTQNAIIKCLLWEGGHSQISYSEGVLRVGVPKYRLFGIEFIPHKLRYA